ncbi:hypothetical protein PACTADRAFT_185071 [Pachysolen tannophilus NRRL Y-2460]|uniref:TATA-binding protein interacting (TIP20) domain-containing protein n=1 Tax=Pachysolen tannophilus NRRL Y-2460 TaxID=669874 RepID=A0A1E4U330_PACTA|nr:hypothetical protein PACTADRAFT_185071 [Pachysolen tannophilus NRRL Y-2460]
MTDAELALVNKVELRIALADTDEKFESSLKLYLAPLLLKLASPNSEVRTTILKSVQHLITRINAATSIKLPIDALLKQVKSPKVADGLDPTSVQLYSALFVSKGIDRLSQEEQKKLIPEVIHGISDLQPSIASRCFHILCKLILNYKQPARATKEANDIRVDFLQFDKFPKDEQFICTCFTKLFLFVPVVNTNGTNTISENYSCPGLSNSDCKFLTTQAGVSFNSTHLTNYKLAILKFISTGFDDKYLLIPLLVASTDSSSSVSDQANSLLKKLTIDYEDGLSIEKLILMIVGNQPLGVKPVKSTLQEKIISNILLRSRFATKSAYISKISSLGLNSDYLKLKQAAIQFIQWVTQNVSSNEISTDVADNESSSFNVTIAAQLKNDLLTDSWSESNSNTRNYAAYVKQRTSQYQALGVILKKNSKLLDNLNYIEFLFDSLRTDLPELRSSIQDALSGLTVHLPNLSHKDKLALKELLYSLLINDETIDECKRSEATSAKHAIEGLYSCRYIAIKYVNCCFSFEDPDARIMCILGTSLNNRTNVIEEALKGLHPYWFSILQSSNSNEFKPTADLLGYNRNVKFPKFANMVSSLSKVVDSSKNGKKSSLRFAMTNAIKFTLQTLVMESIEGKQTVVITDREWDVRLEKSLEYDENVLKLVTEKLTKLSLKVEEENVELDFENNIIRNSLDSFLQIILNEFIGNSINKNDPKVLFGKTFNRILSLSSSATVFKLIPAISNLFKLLKDSSTSVSESLIRYISQAIGIIASHEENSVDSILKLIDDINGASMDMEVKTLALGYLISRLCLRGRCSVLSQTIYENLLEEILNGLKSSNTRVINFSMEAISQLAIFGALGPEVVLTDSVQSYRAKFIEEIRPKVKKCNEKATITWAHLSLTVEDPENSEFDEMGFSDFEKSVYDTHVSKQIEYLFTSGEAITIVASGWNSKVLNRSIDIQGPLKIRLIKNFSRLSFLIEKILNACSNTKPSLRRAGCIWLLSLVQYCGHLKPVKDVAAEMHLAFMRFLADRDEIIQESASRGLSMIFEMGDTDLKHTLVRGLLKSFTDSTSAAILTSGSVSEDTQLFEPGILKTEDGSVSSYKDILNLASEVGDPSLVYKFMSLARNSALWSSRKGVVFGLGSILSKSSLDQLLMTNDKLFKKLIPKLYRYRYDPSTSVQNSMNDIWNTLVIDTSKTISAHFDLILNELLSGMGNKEWRVRQASTVALLDLLQTVPLEKYENRLEEIWNMSLRSVDDIKDSVRKEGNQLTRTLATILIRSIDFASGASLTKASNILSKLIPTLLGPNGLLSDVEDVRNFALETILSLCKKSGVAIRPFIPNLIDQLIMLMSTLEPQIINYLTLNADKYKLKASEIDAKRLQSIGHSPMMDAIESLLDMVDDDLMKDLVPVLRSSIRNSIGLPSKAAGSRVLVTLVVRHLYVVKPHGDQLLKICIHEIKDRNETIASSYASAAGYLCRIASIDAVVSLSKKLKAMYFESDDTRERQIAGMTCESISKYSGDRFSSVSSAFLPFVFVAKHDPDKSVRTFFENEWVDNVSGKGAISYYIGEICALVDEYLDSQKYLIRKVCAESIADACENIDGGLNGMSSKVTYQLFKVILNACKGRTWAGKESVLAALVFLAIKSKKFVYDNEEDDDLLEKINKVILTEAGRNNKEYKKHVIKIMGEYVGSFNEIIEEYVKTMSEVLDDNYYENESDDDDYNVKEFKKLKTGDHENTKSSRKNLRREEERLSLVESLVSAFNIHEDDGKFFYSNELLSLTLNSFLKIYNTDFIVPTWRSYISTCKNMSSLCIKFTIISTKIDLHDEILELFKLSYMQLFKYLDFTIENCRIQFIRCNDKLLKMLSNINANINDVAALKSLIFDNLKVIRDRETSSVVRVELNHALDNN